GSHRSEGTRGADTVMSESLKALRRGAAVLTILLVLAPAMAVAQPAAETALVQAAPTERAGGEANLVLPDLGQVDVGGFNGRTLLLGGLGVAALGVLFGLIILTQVKNLPVHRSMREVSELIYETCKTYLVTQGKFILILWVF